MLGTVGANCFNLFRLPRIVDLKTRSRIELRHHLKPIFILFFYYAATTIYTNLDVVMLGFLTDNSMVGYYNASVKLKNVFTFFLTLCYLTPARQRPYTCLILTLNVGI